MKEKQPYSPNWIPLYDNWGISISINNQMTTIQQGWKIHVMGVTLPRIRGFSYVTWQVFAILPINAMVAK